MNDNDISLLIDLYLDGWNTKRLAVKLQASEDEIKEIVNELNLKAPMKISNPQDMIYKACCTLFGHDKVVQEYAVKNGTRIDVAVPSLGIAIEYHGRQHFEYCQHFHKNHDVFVQAQIRDGEKKETCQKNGWCYIEFNYKDKLTPEYVSAIIVEQYLMHTQADVQTLKSTAAQEKLERQRAYRKNRYRLMKERRKQQAGRNNRG